MNQYRISVNYAKALFLLANEMGQQEQIAADMRLVGTVFAENRTLSVVFDNPIIKQDKKQAIAHELFDAQVSQPTLKFIDFVVQRNRAVHMRGICDAYLSLYREASNITLSNFTTALPVDDAALQAAQTIVHERTGRQVELQTHIDPKIIGGFAIEFNNKMYDARISTQLAKLRKAFADNAYESKL